MPTSSPDSNRIFDVFNQAADLPADRVDSFLARSCVDDTGLRVRVEELLASEDAAVADFLDRPIPALPVLRPSIIISRSTEPSIGPGTLIGSYRIVTEIGRGGMGVVYLAEHRELDKRAVVKVLSQSYARDEQMGQRFISEAKAAASIHHPGIVDVFDVGRHQQSGELFILMEYLAGEPLSARLKSSGQLSQEVALNFISQAANALAAVHEMGIVHRDLKPDNMFVVPDPEVTHGERIKLLDFGIAKLRERDDGSQTQSGMVMGTPQYMSPEQCEGRTDVDHRSDLYAMGIILYQMLAGRRPFEDMATPQYMLAHVRDTPPRLRQFCQHLWPGTAALVDRLLAKSPDQRFQSAYALRDSVQRLLEQNITTGRNAFPYAGHSGRGNRGAEMRASQTVEIVLAEDITPLSTSHMSGIVDASRRGIASDVARPVASTPVAHRSGFPGMVALNKQPARVTVPPPLPPLPGAPTGQQVAQRSPQSMDFHDSPSTVRTLQRSVAPVRWLIQIGGASSLAVMLAVLFVALRWPNGSSDGLSPPEPGPDLSVESPLDRIQRDFDVAPPEVRRVIIEAIRLAAPAQAARIVYRALRDGETTVRIDAVRALCDLDWADAAPKIRQALASGVGGALKVHLAACLAELGDWDSRDMLNRALADDNPNTRLVAAYALALSGQARAARPELNRARTSLPGSRNWLIAHRGLVKLGDKSARDAVRRACASAEFSLAVTAAYMLADAGRQRDEQCGVAFLLRSMQDREFASRGAAALALARLGETASLGYVDRGLEHPLASERRLSIAVASRMANRGGRRFADRIALMASLDRDQDVRIMARVAAVALQSRD